MIFKDKSTPFDKECISCRDGVQEYLGMEVGLEPPTAIKKLFRSADEIKKIVDNLKNLPITDGHIDFYDEIPSDKIVGRVSSSEWVDFIQDDLKSTGYIKNSIILNEEFETSNKELSLGYVCSKREHAEYDLEQYDIVPHHLAIVERGRCGVTCSIKDERNEMEELAKLIEELKAKIDSLIPKGEEKKEDKEVVDSIEKMLKSIVDTSVISDKAVSEFKDSDEFKKLVNDKAQVIADEAIKTRVEVIAKAQGFLDKDYDFTKDTITIIKDTLAKCGVVADTGEEIVAFKYLKAPTADYSNFSDAQVTAWSLLKDKEI